MLKLVFVSLVMLSPFYSNDVVALEAIEGKVCNSKFSVVNKGVRKAQVVPISTSASMNIENLVSTFVVNKAKVASNITCQQLNGMNFSGSVQEWEKFFQSAIAGLQAANYKNIKFQAINGSDKLYQGEGDAKEYQITSEYGGIVHIIRNLAVLKKDENTVYTYSVSGSSGVAKAVAEEYKRLVKSIH